MIIFIYNSLKKKSTASFLGLDSIKDIYSQDCYKRVSLLFYYPQSVEEIQDI